MGRINDAVGVCLCNSTVLCTPHFHSAVVYSVMCDRNKCQLGLSKQI